MILLSFQKLGGGVGKFHDGRFCTGVRKTKVGDKFRKRFLVLRRMESTIKRRTLDLVGEPLLNILRRFDGDTRVALIALHQHLMHDETDSVFVNQNLASELNGLTLTSRTGCPLPVSR